MGVWGILLFSATPHSCKKAFGKLLEGHVSRRLPVGSLANRVSKHPVSWKTHVGIPEKEVGKAVTFFYSHPLLPGLGGAYPLTAAVAGGSDRVGQAEPTAVGGPFSGGHLGVHRVPQDSRVKHHFPPIEMVILGYAANEYRLFWTNPCAS